MGAVEKARISTNIKIRVLLEQEGYSGYIYNTQHELKEGDDYILIDAELDDGWNKVVKFCWTKIGCRNSVLNWVKTHTIKEYNVTLEVK